MPSPSPIETTRTSSPYFSPNSAIAPVSTAASGVISRVVTSLFSRTRAFTSLRPRQVVARDRARLADVEAQPVRRVKAALLGDMVAEPPPQSLMQQMGRAVMRADRGAARVVDRRDHRRADHRLAGLDPAEMHEQIA